MAPLLPEALPMTPTVQPPPGPPLQVLPDVDVMEWLVDGEDIVRERTPAVR